MKCPFCQIEVPEWDKPIKTHLIATKNPKDDHIHVHGPLEDKNAMRQLIDTSLETLNLGKGEEKNLLEKKEIIFHNRQRIGDVLMFTAAIRDFKAIFPDVKVNVNSTAMHIWDNNPYLDRTLIPNEQNTLKIGPSRLTNSSNRLDWHFANAYRMSIEDALKINIPQGESIPDIWLTEEEFNAPRVNEKPYWIIVIGGEKSWGCKMYPFERWQEFVKQNPDTLFYQLGAREDNHPKLIGRNVVDYIGKTQDHNTGIRDLFKLFLNAEGSIGLVSFHMHLSAAFRKPCIVVAGAREPVSFTRYPGHRYLATDGCLPCGIKACWHCDINTCEDLVIVNNEKIPRCVDLIVPEDLTQALNLYYLGGRLKKDNVSAKPEFKNIVKGQKVSVTVPKEKEEPKETKYGIPFGGSSFTSEDWKFIKDAIDKYEVKRILEFGCGLSTLLFNEIANTISFETDESLINKIKGINQKCDIRKWDGKALDLKDLFDLAFVDAPSGGVNREISTKIASELADIVIIHDANREYEKKWQEKYIKDNFNGPTKGGHRCSLWLKKSKFEAQTCSKNDVVEPISKPSEKKYIKFVFNGRGDGGAEKSVTWMMNTLVEMGHHVTYHTPNPMPCGTFRNKGDKTIEVKNCDSLHEACDILVLYSNDWVWDFVKPEICDMFSNINAGRKVLCVNYKLDKIGIIPWTKDWDLYLFLNSTFERALLERLPDAKTKVMAPPTDLTKFFEITPDYSNGLRLIRHSSQGDCKYPKDFNEIIEQILKIRTDVSIRLMPPPSFLKKFDRVISHQRNNPPVSEFLKLGNCFFYILPTNFSEGGPKVLMESQASGLPVIADNHSGMIDRVVEKTGWLANSIEEHINIIKNISVKELEEYGANAREHARKEYNPMNWINNILGNV
jgi:ADP-heptose:LPS heptosyltransferase